MSKPKYKAGRPVYTVGEFERCESLFFKVRFGSNLKTLHRSFLEAWQFHTLQWFCRCGKVYEAERIEE